ncbi:MAG: right-handed parallel beta-helix repeat-containing protein [Spirochaetales bacterium]|nr:right-handed parallel beta-helix repeat-containing protein [Spirochaetales bacterium]
MNFRLRLFCAVALVVLSTAAFAAPLPIEEAVSLAAQDIETSLQPGTRAAVLVCRSASEHLSRYIVNELVFALVGAGKLVIVDREDMDLIRKELMFQLSGEVSEASMQEIGAVLGAEVIISCTVDEGAVLRTKAVAVATSRLLAVSSRSILQAGTYLTLTDDLGAMHTVTVRTADELLSAIGPDRIIHLAPGTYNLSRAHQIQNRYVSWRDEYDGPCPVITSAANLSFRGDEGALVVADPAYGWVLSFETCSGVNISNITFGHTTPGYCLGGVLRFANCTDVSIRSSDLYGSGTTGIELDRVDNFIMDSSIVRECTYALMYIEDSSNVRFSYCQFKDTGEYSLIQIADSDNVRWHYSEFTGNRGYTLFSVDYLSRDLGIEGGRIENNDVKTFCNYPRRLTVEQVAFSNNRFDGQ